MVVGGMTDCVTIDFLTQFKIVETKTNYRSTFISICCRTKSNFFSEFVESRLLLQLRELL